MRNRQPRMLAGIAVLISIFSYATLQNVFAGTPQNAHVIKEVRHELVTLPYYGVFDWLEYEVKTDNTVILGGQALRPSTKSDAEARVKDIEGVSKVVNEIEVLPLSPQDDRLRRALSRTPYGTNSPLFRYATQAVPSIHIIVKGWTRDIKGHSGYEG